MFQSTLCSPVIFYFAVPLINDTSFIFNHFFSGKAHEYFLSIFKSDTVLCLYLWTLSWLGVIVSTAVFFPSTFVSSAPSSVIGCGEAWSQLIFFPHTGGLHFLHEFLKGSFVLLHFSTLTRPCLRAESFILNSRRTEYSFNLQIFFSILGKFILCPQNIFWYIYWCFYFSDTSCISFL